MWLLNISGLAHSEAYTAYINPETSQRLLPQILRRVILVITLEFLRIPLCVCLCVWVCLCVSFCVNVDSWNRLR